MLCCLVFFFFFQAEDGIRDLVRSRGLGDVYKRQAKEEGKEKVILFNLSGHGLIDMASYDKYLSGQLGNYEVPQELIDKNIAKLEKLV